MAKRSDHPLQAFVAGFHPFLHAGGQHALAGDLVRQRHAHRHEGSRAVRVEASLDVVIGSWIRQVHPLDMDNTAIGLELDELTSEVEAASFAVRPFIANPAVWFRLTDTYGHRPTLRAQ